MRFFIACKTVEGIDGEKARLRRRTKRAISAAPGRASDLSVKKSGMLTGTLDCATTQGGGSREM
jgi:hypothetical protein